MSNIPKMYLDVANVREGEEILATDGWVSDEHKSAEQMSAKVFSRLFISGMPMAELELYSFEALRWGWITQPAPRDPDQCLSSEPLGRLWVVYKKTLKTGGENGIAPE